MTRTYSSSGSKSDGELFSTYTSTAANALSRAEGLTLGGSPLCSYAYLGMSVFVNVTYNAASSLELTAVTGGTGDAGDQYTALDRFGRLIETLWQTSGSSALVHSKYGRNQVGGIVWRQDLEAAALSVPTQDNYYWYDGLQQVTEHKQGTLTGTYPDFTGITALQQEEDFGYDPTGNWASYDILSPSNAQTRTHSKANEITDITSGLGSVVPTYSLVGNMTTLPINPGLSTSQYTLTWDAWNRLISVKNGSTTVATYAYDGLSRRITKTTSAETDNFYYSKEWQVLEVLSTGSVATTQFLWGLRSVDDLIARNQIYSSASHWLYSLSDQWNVVAVTNASAVVQERYAYNAFGTTLFMTAAFVAESGSSYNWETTFCSYRLDAETGFYQVRYRYLHPTLGRWLSRDPVTESGGLNLYAYALNQPVNLNDPFGLQTVTGSNPSLSDESDLSGNAFHNLGSDLGHNWNKLFNPDNNPFPVLTFKNPCPPGEVPVSASSSLGVPAIINPDGTITVDIHSTGSAGRIENAAGGQNYINMLKNSTVTVKCGPCPPIGPGPAPGPAPMGPPITTGF